MNMDNERLKVYSWEFPVRFTHWINFLCIIALSVTGFYIGNPFMHAISSKQYIMGWMRFIHFTAAYTFLMNFIFRIYWGFAGNKCASFRWWFPSSADWFRDFAKSLKFYLFLRKKAPSVGHTALAGFTYLIIFAIFIFQIISGFALYSVNHSGAIWTLLGGWLTGVMYLQTIRLYHHLFMYVLLAFAILHVYSAWYCDLKEKNGLMGSIFNGYKYLMGKECGQ
jgi:Ni/Fe-hydrogenase 1 B-type cytochrome subunit